jgi:hypothetical protein
MISYAFIVIQRFGYILYAAIDCSLKWTKW